MKYLVFIIKNFKERRIKQMAVGWATLIMYGEATFAEVPKRFKEKVRKILKVWGLDENGEPIKDDTPQVP